MRKIKYFIPAIGLCALTFAACTNKYDVPGNNLPEGSVDITATIDGAQTRSPQLDADGAGVFEVDDVWGLYTFTGDAASPICSNENIAHYADNRNPLRWKDLGEGNVVFSAHYPRQATVADPEAYEFNLGGINRTADDLLFATATHSRGEKIELVFKHLMHRLVINLRTGTGMEGVDLSEAVIDMAVNNGKGIMRSDIQVNLLTGVVSPGRTTGAVIGYSYSGSNFDCIAVPQDLPSGVDWFKITVGVDEWYFQVPDDLNPIEPGNQTMLESGKCLTLNLSLKKNSQTGNPEVEMQSSEITGWDDYTADDEMVSEKPTVTITAEEVKAALEGTSTEPIVVEGDIALDFDDPLVMGADHTLTIFPGVTLTISNGDGITCYSDSVPRTLTVNGGGTLLADESNEIYNIISDGTLRLDNVTLEIRGGAVAGDIEVGKGATVVANSMLSMPISATNMTVRGTVKLENFKGTGLNCSKLLLIDGGTISIDGIGILDYILTPIAVEIRYNANMEIANGGRLVSSIENGAVSLKGAAKVKGAKGLFRIGDYTLDTDELVEVDNYMYFRRGVYHWRSAEDKFVWVQYQD